MPAPNLIRRFAEEILEPDCLPIAKEIVDKHVDNAMAAKDKPRLTKLLALAEIIDGEIDKPATPDN